MKQDSSLTYLQNIIISEGCKCLSTSKKNKIINPMEPSYEVGNMIALTADYIKHSHIPQRSCSDDDTTVVNSH